ncbi:MAG TPA: histidine kinase [Woeseiaceae bacterium]|nr:histidine kinase [Woeseiaceae bacterium]
MNETGGNDETLSLRGALPSLAGPWLTAWGVATLLSLLIAYQNLPVVQQAGLPLDLWDLYLRELVVWYSWAALLPIIYFLTLRYPVSGQWRWRNLAIHGFAAPLFVLAVIAISAPLRIALFPDVMPEAPLFEAVLIVYRRFFAFFLFVYAGTAAILQARRQAVERREQAAAQSQLQLMLQESRLENLRAQLDPHFLFNALNAISSLVVREPSRARHMIARLSGLLRMSLSQEGRGLVPLSQELELLGVYLEIQQLRFGDRLRVSLEIDDRAESAVLPRLLLQPLVENAVHHGIEQRAAAGRIDIHVGEESGHLRIAVLDDGPGFAPEATERVGLGNARARLALHFGDAASLTRENRPEGGACVQVVLPLRMETQEGTRCSR